MNWKDVKVLITGAGGFIGSHLTEALVGLGADVTCFLRYNSRNDWGFIDTLLPSLKEKITVIAGDLKDSDAVRKAANNKSILFHLGAAIAIPYSYRHPRDFVQTNILGTLNVLVAALENNVKRVIHTSTSEVYGTAQKIPIDEKHPLQAQSPYSATKVAADKLAESYHLSYDLPVVTVRPFNTFGPRQSNRAIVSTIITQVLTRDEILLGNLNPTRDFTYVTDIVRGFIELAGCQDAVGQTVNLGTGTEISIADLTDKVIKLTGKRCRVRRDPVRVRPPKSEVLRLCADTSKAQRLTGWKPEISLDDGLRKTVDWISENLPLYKTEFYNI